jgi:BTB/POZ domain
MYYLYFQDFKCHKQILAKASNVFQAMLFGNSENVKLGPDDPIQLEIGDPYAFSALMRYDNNNNGHQCGEVYLKKQVNPELKNISRFVYGREMIFTRNSVNIVVEVYELAHEMQIYSLTNELDNFFTKTKASEMFAVYNLLLKLGKHQQLLHYKQVQRP